MAMKTLFFNEHEGNLHNLIGQLSSVPSVPWWTAIGTQSYAESCGQTKPSSLEEPSGGDQLTASKQLRYGTEREMDKGSTTPFTIFPGDSKTKGGGLKPPLAVISAQKALPEYLAHFDPVSGQHLGRIMVPMNMETDDGLIYVNPKQYYRIIRRRKSRAKAVLENKLTRTHKPYMHYSRHLHAMRRPRGCGGRFLNKKNLRDRKSGNEPKKAGDVPLFQPSGSQSSEVLQFESGTLNTSKETYSSGSNISGSEVTSTCSLGELDHLPINHLDPTVHFFPGMMDPGHGIVMPSKWVAAADACCNLKV